MTQAVNNGSSEHPAALFIAALFGPTTEQPVFFQSLANNASDQDEARYKPQLLTRDIAPIGRFISRHDRARRGLFFCVATVAKDASTRSKETVRETIGLHADIDFKNVLEDEPTIRTRLETLRCQPTIIVRSGGGLHLYWLFRESVDTQVYMDPLEVALKALAEIVAGDPAVCEVSRLMRLPGTHNSKRGDMREVVCERLDGPRYELDELEEWLSEQQPILTRKPIESNPRGPNPRGQALEPVDDNPWIAAAEKWGIKLRLDVDALLAAMGDGNIHDSLLRASASLISTGRDFEEAVAILMEASRRVGGADWDWRRQEKEIRGMCSSAQNKFPPKEPAVSWETTDEPPPDDDNVVNFDEAKAKAKPKPKRRGPGALLAPFVVADGVIETLRRHGADILLSEGEVWLYGDGFWRIMTSADQQWLLTMIQEGFERLREPGKTSSLASSWKRINEHPGLFRAVVPWAGSSMIVCRNGVIVADEGAPDGWRFEAHKPENYARRHIGADFEPRADCPQFVTLLESMFSDRPDAHIVISLIQEWLGAALAVATLKREQRRALIPVGVSRTGKTEMTLIFKALLGGPIATPSAKEFGERFGLETLYDAVAWIRDDAINEGDRLDPQRFKTVVTGEAIDIDRKNKPAVRDVRLDIPVLLTANSLARVRDSTDAVFNRSIILTMTNVIDAETAHAARVTIGAGEQSIGLAIFEREASGILNWALIGLQRLRKRGFYDIPESIKAAITQYKDDNNPVGEWAREALVADPSSRVGRSDLVRAYNGWELEQEGGDEAHAHGSRWLMPRLRNQVKGLGEHQVHNGQRYITGVRLTALGLALWTSYGDASPRGGAGGISTSASEVNRPHNMA